MMCSTSYSRNQKRRTTDKGLINVDSKIDLRSEDNTLDEIYLRILKESINYII